MHYTSYILYRSWGCSSITQSQKRRYIFLQSYSTSHEQENSWEKDGRDWNKKEECVALFTYVITPVTVVNTADLFVFPVTSVLSGPARCVVKMELWMSIMRLRKEAAQTARIILACSLKSVNFVSVPVSCDILELHLCLLAASGYISLKFSFWKFSGYGKTHVTF